MSDLGKIATDALAGAASGLAGGPIGAGVGALSAVVTDLAGSTGLTRWLFGPTASKTTADVAAAVAAVTGTPDPAAQVAVLERDPAAALALQGKLAEIAAARQAEADAAMLDALKAQLADVANARAQTLGLAASHSAIAWAAPVVSLVVLTTFGVVMGLALTRSFPPGSETILNMLLGTLAAMATSTVSYWLGSSAGSASKQVTLDKIATAP